jgi:hypothetical protein
MLYMWKARAQSLGNVPRGRMKEEVKHTLLENRSMWKQKKQKGGKNLMMRNILLKPREGYGGTNSANKSIQNYLQDERESLQGDDRQWEH